MPHPPNTPLGRLGVETLDDNPVRCVAAIPVGGLLNPLTGTPTVAPLAMLVDHVGGLVNHYRREPDEWTVSSEFSLELTPNATALIAAAPDVPVVATGRPFGPKGTASLGLCELTHDGHLVASATVRSFYVRAPGHIAEWPTGPAQEVPPTGLDGRIVDPLQTASLRINFLRRFRGGTESRYEGTAFRVGRSSGIGEARAVGDDGKVAIIARLTTYSG